MDYSIYRVLNNAQFIYSFKTFAWEQGTKPANVAPDCYGNISKHGVDGFYWRFVWRDNQYYDELVQFAFTFAPNALVLGRPSLEGGVRVLQSLNDATSHEWCLIQDILGRYYYRLIDEDNDTLAQYRHLGPVVKKVYRWASAMFMASIKEDKPSELRRLQEVK